MPHGSRGSAARAIGAGGLVAGALDITFVCLIGIPIALCARRFGRAEEVA